MGVFERFTEQAQKAVVLADQEARMLHHDYVGTEHLLLGLIGEKEGVAARVLESLGVSLAGLRKQVESMGQGQPVPTDQLQYSARAKWVIKQSLREALALGSSSVGTEHILLGLIREGEGLGAQALGNLGIDLNLVRQRIILMLSGYQGD